jgi:hypothetical protein
MAHRKWLVRFLVLLVLGCCAGAGVLYQQWTNPVAVRQQVVTLLEKQFPGASVSLDGARLRLLGGVVLTELRLTRRGAGEQADIIHIPSATVYHDKERLLDGRFAVRRIELHRPRIHIVRRKDGTWNVDGLVGTTDPRSPLPTILINDGTLVIEDLHAGPARWEINDVNLTLLNDPVTCLTFTGTGQSEALGKVEVRGSWQRDTGVTTLALEVVGLRVNKDLVQYISGLCPDRNLSGLHLEGWMDLKLGATYTPGAAPALRHELRCTLRQFHVEHPDLPLPLDNLSASLACADGKLTLERLKAAAGTAHVECKGWAHTAHPEENFAVEVTALHLAVTPKVGERLPPGGKRLYDLYQPTGNTRVQFIGEKKDGEWVKQRLVLQPDDVSICFRQFRYPIDRVAGTIEHDFLANTTKFDAAGFAGTRPVTAKGYWNGSGAQSDAQIEILAQDLPLDNKLLEALPLSVKDQAAAFHPAGHGHIYALIKRIPGNGEYQGFYQVRFLDSTCKWKEFPYALEEVSGDLLIYPDHYEFRDFHGRHNGADIYVTGQTLPRTGSPDDGKLVMSIAGRNLRLDGDLQAALQPFPGLSKTWETFAPAGQLSFQTQIERLPGPGQPNELDITVNVAGCAIEPSFFRYALHDVAGQFRYARNKVEIKNFTARHNDSQLSVEHGTVDLLPHGGFRAELDNLVANPVLADEALLGAVPAALRGTMEAVNLKDQWFALQTRLVVSQEAEGQPPQIYWNGHVRVKDAELRAGIDVNHVTGILACRGLHNGKQMAGLCGNLYFDEATVFKQPLQGVRGHFAMREDAPDVMTFGLQAPLFGGDICGQGWLEFGRQLRYEVDLTASQIRLEEFGRNNLGPKEDLSGIMAGRLFLHGRGAGLAGLEGDGMLDIPYSPLTRLLNLPPLVALLKFLGLRWPDRTAFEEAHAVFAIHGQRVNVSKLDLLGNVISLYGHGEVNLDGSDAQLEFYPSWGRAEQMFPSGIRDIPATISKQLMKIEMRGQIGGKDGDLTFSKRPVPGLIDPLLEMRDRFVGKN